MTTAVVADEDPRLSALVDWISSCAGAHAITVALPGEAALALVGLVQLAARHPDVSETMRAIAHEFVSTIADQCPPNISEVMALGWNPEADVPMENAGG